VTTILDMPLNSVPATTTVDALTVKRDVADGQCAVDVGFWGGAVPDSLGHLRELYDAGVFGFKCFLLDSGVPEFPPLSTAQLRQAMTEIAAFDGILIVHAEDPLIIGRSGGQAGAHYADFLASRPDTAETSAIETVIAASRDTGCRTHIVHLSSAAALPAIVAARSAGVRLTVETCPHYLTLAAEDVPDGHTEYKCCPPIRGQHNADQLWQALADGVLDMIVSDHSPSTPALKFAGDGDFAVAWGGISSLELGLSLIWTEASRRGHPLETVVGWMASAPARVVGVAGKGAISLGADADFVVFAPEATFVVDAATLHHRHPISPYQGRRLQGVVRRSYLRGQMVDVDGAPQGQLRQAPGHRLGRTNGLPPAAIDTAAAEAVAAVSTTGFVGA
jgi:allantoinase